MGSDPGNMVLHNRMLQIFDILSFCKNKADFVVKKGIFWDFRYFCTEKRPYFCKNSKYQKFVTYNCGEPFLLVLSQFSASEINFQASFFPFWAIFQKQNLRFWGDFPIQICENAWVGANFVMSYLGSHFFPR